jgi:hypothetical protein
MRQNKGFVCTANPEMLAKNKNKLEDFLWVLQAL